MKISRFILVFTLSVLLWNGMAACGKKRSTPPTNQEVTTQQDGGTTPLPKTDRPSVTPDEGSSQPDIKKPIPDPKPPPNPRCATIFECAKEKQCAHFPSIDCLDKCATEKKVSDAGRTRFMALKTCMTTNCATCQPTDSNCLSKCVMNNCSSAWIACATDEQTGSNNCKQASDCIKNCATDTDCIAKCLSQADKSSQTLYTKNSLCEDKLKSPTTPPAERTSCYQTNLACICPESKAGQGAGSCADYLTCIESCGTDKCCVAKCRSTSAAATLPQADKFTLCVSDKCSSCPAGDKTCTGKCALEKCSNEYLGCKCPGVGAPGTGRGKCKNALTCSDRCALNDTCCFARCTAQLSAKSYQYYLRFIKCLPKCGCSNSDKACLSRCAQKQCANEAFKCYTK